MKWLRKHAGHWEVHIDPGVWTREDGTKFSPLVYFSAYGTAYSGRTLDEALELAMQR